ncbi:ribosomal subunit interface protein [Massilia sp. Root133]|jgi:ribosome-associated translation inhibitor RaiA|uniref:Ribosomal subunit interface protein n=1 Tax=Massilia cellulosiltytica TaxID=2683234 RepID=A0A7X3KBB2_9BURK|nr:MULTISPECIES: HPF/RaiA family ribosome-associated protein [Telluria group]KQY14248.1 ribosomal subunit interface protein [Massilia sp. Root133]KQZ40196.1 ribosomal subunit interface protein [Massilia sp. Root1485]MVW63901.1 ribosomal subunit interface protein [Telluria cellulosilytica]
MEVNVNTDNTIQRHSGLDERVRTMVEEAIGRFGDHVRRVDVHLSNENKEKHEDGSNYCMMEALVSGYAPVVVHAHAENLQQSITSAVGKLKRALDSAIGRLNDKNKREPLPVDAESDKDLTSNS